jgi:monovalent cation:H+ antiporter-2, CPA2 family
VFAYLSAGLIIGPYLPIPLYANESRIHSLSEFGVILVMFNVGLEFQIKNFLKLLPSTGLVTLAQVGALFAVGYGTGKLVGWSDLEALFLGAGICISSTMIVLRILDRNPAEKSVRSHVLSVLILQDFVAIVLIAIMTAVTAGVSISTADLVNTVSKLLITLAMMTGIGFLIVPKAFRWIEKNQNAEAMAISACGLCFSFAYLAQVMGYSTAFGAFISGILVSESGKGHSFRQLLLPVKNIFAAVFFVSVGMSVDPLQAFAELPISILICCLVILTHFVCVTFFSVLSGKNFRESIASSLALGQIGEFSFIIVAIGITANVIDPKLQAVLVTVAILTTLTSDKLTQRANQIADYLEAKLPKRFYLFFKVYLDWFHNSKFDFTFKSVLLKTLFFLVVDYLAFLLVVLATWSYRAEIQTLLPQVELIELYFKPLLALGILFAGSPFAFGFIKNWLSLKNHVAVLFRPDDPFAKIFLPVFQSIIVVAGIIAIGFPLSVALGVVFKNITVFIFFLPLLIYAVRAFWRKLGLFQEDLTSGASVFFNHISSGLDGQHLHSHDEKKSDFEIRQLTLPPDSPTIGKSLIDTNIRAITGASVVAILRKGCQPILPTGKDLLRAGDVLSIVGTPKSLDLAQNLVQKK